MKVSLKQKEQLKNILASYICGLGGEDQLNKAYQFTTLSDRELIEVILEKIKKI